MSSFKLSPEAKVYIPMQEELEKLRRWREKIYPGMSDHAIEYHQRGLLTPEEREDARKRSSAGLLKWIGELSDENKSLKEEIKKYDDSLSEKQGELDALSVKLHGLIDKSKSLMLGQSKKIKKLEEKSEEDQKTITNLKKELEKKELTIQEEYYLSVIDRVNEDIETVTEHAENCLRIIAEWQGRSVKLNWILKEMEKVGAIKGDHEWVQDLRRSIEFPNDDGINLGDSIFQDVPLNVIQNNLPSHLDAHMEIVDEDTENERIEELSEEANSFVEQEKTTACIKIQKMWRKNRGKILYHWIDDETENIMGSMFDEDERAKTLEYLEIYWKRLYRNHYNLGYFDPIPGRCITLSYNDFVSLSRGTL
jgi:3-methyladenine DNA glycosylase AlkC